MYVRNKKEHDCICFCILFLYLVFGAESMEKNLFKRQGIRISRTVRLLMRDNELDVNESFCLEMNSEGELSIKGAEEISEYTDCSVFITSREYYVEIKGCGLRLKNYSKAVTGILGEISNISFLKR